jgi:hypothetical protein
MSLTHRHARPRPLSISIDAHLMHSRQEILCAAHTLGKAARTHNPSLARQVADARPLHAPETAGGPLTRFSGEQGGGQCARMRTWAMSTMSAVWRISELLPPMLGPVMTMARCRSHPGPTQRAPTPTQSHKAAADDSTRAAQHHFPPPIEDLSWCATR